MNTTLAVKPELRHVMRMASIRRWLAPGALGILLASAVASQGETAVAAWGQRYGFGGIGSTDSASKVVTDAAGNVIVAGDTDEHVFSAPDMLVTKYSGAGVPLWANRYSGPGNADDTVADLAVDSSGNVIVTGESIGYFTGQDYATIKYSAAGMPLWTNRYHSSGLNRDSPNAIAVDSSDNVFVTGESGSGQGASDNDYVTIAYSAAGVPLWTNRYNGLASSTDFAREIAVDVTGNIFVTGSSASTSGFPPHYDFATIKYSGAGVPLWTNRYNGPGDFDDHPSAIAVDADGNVLVAGSSPDANSTDYAIIKYSNAGVPLWTNRYNGPGNNEDAAHAIAVDARGNVFVTGLSRTSDTNADYATVAYSGAGVPLWTNRYDYGLDYARALAVDASGNVFVTGYSGVGVPRPLYDYATVAYSGAGVPLWTNRYNGPANGLDYARALAVDSSGNVFVTGASADNIDANSDWATLAYSGTGAPLWTNRYNGPDNSRQDYATGVAVDSSGDVFVTGQSYEASGEISDIATIKYSGAGLPLWTNRYHTPGIYDDRAWAIAVDASGNVFVTGSSYLSGYVADYLTIAYSGAGLPLWTNRYHDSGDSQDLASAIAVDASGNVVVTGISMGNGTSYDFATIKYSGVGVPLWTNRYNGPGNGSDGASAIAVDGSGSVFVTGYSSAPGGIGDYATIAYSGAGVPLWTNRYNGPGNSEDYASAIAVDVTGKVFVTGASATKSAYPYAWDYVTIAYSGAGTPVWTNRYNGPGNDDDQASAIAVDASGNVFVTGFSMGNGTSYDFATIAYSGAGVALWTNRYSGPTNVYDAPSAIQVDASGNVFVTGNSSPGDGNSDYVTIKYSGAGLPLWTNRYNGPGDGADQPQGRTSLAIGPDGAVYVTGASDGVYGSGDTGFDYATIKYVTVPVLAIQPPAGGSSDVHLMLSGTPNSVWTVERAAALPGPWTNLGPVTILTNGSAPFLDPTPPKPAAFYRAVTP